MSTQKRALRQLHFHFFLQISWAKIYPIKHARSLAEDIFIFLEACNSYHQSVKVTVDHRSDRSRTTIKKMYPARVHTCFIGRLMRDLFVKKLKN